MLRPAHPFKSTHTMHKLIPRRSTLVLAASAPWLVTACGSTPSDAPVLHRTAKPAGFKLADMRLAWQDNPGLRYNIIYMQLENVTTGAVSTLDKERANAYMGKVFTLFRTLAVPTATASLAEAGAQPGTTHTVLLRPLTGEYNAPASQCRVLFRVLVQDSRRKLLYMTDIEVRSHWVASRISIAEPDESFVKDFAQVLVATFRQAGLLG